MLRARIWEEKTARDHRELVHQLDAVIETVAKPDHVEPDALSGRLRSTDAMWAPAVLDRDGRLIVTVPETVEATAEDLAPVLRAG